PRVHVSRTGPRRAGRSPGRPVQSRQRPLRLLHRPATLSRSVRSGRGAGGERTGRAGPSLAEPGRLRLAEILHRPAHGEESGRPLSERCGGGRLAGGLPIPPAPAGSGPGATASAPRWRKGGPSSGPEGESSKCLLRTPKELVAVARLGRH